MKAIKIAMLMTALVAPAQAQSYVESNATDAMCEWHFKQKGGSEKCRILAMGALSMGDSVFELAVDGMVVSMIETHDGKKTVKIGNWTGTYTSKFKMLGELLAIQDIKLSNGYSIKVVY